MLSKKNAKVLLLMLIDALCVVFSGFFALWLRAEFNLSSISDDYIHNLLIYLPVHILTVVLLFYFFKLYHFVWRFASTHEFSMLLVAVFAASRVQIVVCHVIFLRFSISVGYYMPRSYYLLDGMFLFVSTMAVRFTYRLFVSYRTKHNVDGNVSHCMIIGAGSAADSILREIAASKYLNKTVKCLIDDSPEKRGRFLQGVKIVGGRDYIRTAVDEYGIDEIIIAMPSVSKKEIGQIVNICNSTTAKLSILPGTYQLVNGDVSVKNLRDVDVDDLLGRDMVELNTAQISGYLQGKKVLVTGAGGSIGSELCRQIIRYEPAELILFDVYENGVYDLQQELLAKQRVETNAPTKLHVLIGSVCDKQRVEAVFNKYRPDIIYHAAAHKHVPLMEDSPHEAVRNNVFGTLNLAICADAVGVSRFVMISTDKAVNPTNIMGATKRICEMIVQSFAQKSKTAFVAVRFGNVLGSNGSVIPLFKKQIEAGGPLTVTHPDIIRYFMTITEASSLVIQAGAYANGGEIFVLDMGEPVKIAELAANLIRMSGFTPGRDIEIVYIGLRPGEKLYEEMLMGEEGMTKTDNQLIYIGKPLHFDDEAFIQQIDELWHTAQDESSDIRGLVARITGTYKYSEQ